MTPDNVIAIDGPAASGKSTIARKLSEKLNVPYVNTGNMYRAVTWLLMENGFDPEVTTDDFASKFLASKSLEYKKLPGNKDFDVIIDGKMPGQKIRTPEISAHVSKVAALPSVRKWMLEKQRGMARLGLIVMEGRDIGTVIFPNAKNKFFLTASPLERAKRRLAQEGEAPDGATVESVAREIAARDEQDMKRETAPLRMADDAIFVDSSDKSVEQTLEYVLERIRK